jgi:hypothetical protein
LAALLVEREGCQHAIADELQDLAAIFTQHACQGLEDIVEQVDDRMGGSVVGDSRKAPDVGIPQYGMNTLDRPTFDFPTVHAAAGSLAQIDLQQPRRIDLTCVRLHRQRQGRQRRAEQVNVAVAEASGPIGHKGVGDSQTTGSFPSMVEQLGQIVGCAGGMETFERGKVALRRALGQPSADAWVAIARFRAFGEMVEDSTDPTRRRRVLMTELRQLDEREVALPREAGAPPSRVQRLECRIATPKRKSFSQQMLAETREQVVRGLAA